MQPERATGRLMRMKNELRITAGHAATLQVGEKGTVASAATAAGAVASAAQAGPPPVVFDRPPPDGDERPDDRRTAVHGPGHRPDAALARPEKRVYGARMRLAGRVKKVTGKGRHRDRAS
jgi:hypothetical protein